MINRQANSSIDSSGDQDWFRISLTQGTNYTFNQNAANGSRIDTLLRLLDSNGNTIARNDDFNGTLNSQITFTATSTGTYYLSAQAFSNIGDYTLSAAVI